MREDQMEDEIIKLINFIDRTYKLFNLPYNKSLPKPKKVIYNNPATIILWTDGTKTISKCDKDDTFSKEAGFMTCMLKKIYGNPVIFSSEYKKEFLELTGDTGGKQIIKKHPVISVTGCFFNDNIQRYSESFRKFSVSL